jgi:hypothetical protein
MREETMKAAAKGDVELRAEEARLALEDAERALTAAKQENDIAVQVLCFAALTTFTALTTSPPREQSPQSTLVLTCARRSL